MRVFVAGASGAIGRSLVPMLLERGHQITGMTRSEQSAEWLRGVGADAAVADVYDEDRVAEVVRAAAPDVVVHQLTALTGMNPRKPGAAYAETGRLRTEGTRILLGAARGAGARRLVAQSISFVCAPEGPPVLDEQARPWSEAPAPFGQAVADVIELERQVTEVDGIEGLALRYGFFYGPGTEYAADGGAADAVRKRRQPVVGAGTGVFSFLHIDDAATATVAAIERDGTGVYNVTDDDPGPLRDWLPAYAEALGARRPFRIPAFVARLAAPRALVDMALTMRGASNQRFKRDFGWSPRYPSWREGFSQTLG